jgi:hypothetical protein
MVGGDKANEAMFDIDIAPLAAGGILPSDTKQLGASRWLSTRKVDKKK